MKKILFFLPFLLLGSVIVKAQSIKLTDLVYLTPMNNDAVYAVLKEGGAFKQDYSEEVDGYPMEYFKKAGAKPDLERIAVGMYTKLYNGTILRTLNYTSTDVQNIDNMVSQAKRTDMVLLFEGADVANSIYLFTNNYYLVSIYVRHDKSSGTVEIKQKEFLNID
jgi:hypothetical protein